MTYLPKHPHLNICKLSPKLNGCDFFLSCNLLLHVLYNEITIQFLFDIFYGVTRPAKGFF